MVFFWTATTCTGAAGSFSPESLEQLSKKRRGREAAKIPGRRHDFLRPFRARAFPAFTQGLRPGLHSWAASRLVCLMLKNSLRNSLLASADSPMQPEIAIGRR